MENGFASAWKLVLHWDIEHFQNRVFGDAFWGNGASLFGIIAYVPASALVTSSKTPPNQVPKNLAFGKPFSQFGKGKPRLPLLTVSLQHPWGLLRLPLWANVLISAWATSASLSGLLGYCLLGVAVGIAWSGLPLRSWVDMFPSFLLLETFLPKILLNISKSSKKVANRVQW